MIQPVQNLNNYSNLTPVEVPHFSGAGSACGSKNLTPVEVPHFSGAGDSDTFTKKTNSPLKRKTKRAVQSAAKGAKKGFRVITSSIKNGVEFTATLVSSIAEDTNKVFKAKGTKILTNVDGIIV